MRFGTGPVFAYERLTASRRWQGYALRSFGLASLLIAMGAIAASHGAFFEARSVKSLSEYARLGAAYFSAIVGVEMVLVMLAAPAATAGAICLDRSRGTLEHMMATDLSDSEIVLGKLGARLMPVFGLIACSLPVLALSTLLGGIDLAALIVAFVVIAAVAMFGCSLALALSVWARKPHEVVLAVYAVWGIALVLHPMWEGMARVHLVASPPGWAVLANPFLPAFLPLNDPGPVGMGISLGFVAATVVLSAFLVQLTIWTVRPAATRGRGRTERAPERSLAGRIARRLPGPSLDRNPVLWREWYRSRSPRLSALLALLIGMTTAACAFKAIVIWNVGVESSERGLSDHGGLYSFLVPLVFGLLVLAAVAPLSLSEERQRGSLDVLMTTPLQTRTIVLGKWLGSFRLIPWLAVGPAILALALAVSPAVLTRPWDHYNPWLNSADIPLSPGERLFGCWVLVATILAHGAATSAVGLGLATWVRHQSRAIALSVILFVTIAVAWPMLAWTLSDSSGGSETIKRMAWSPLYVIVAISEALAWRQSFARDLLMAAAVQAACVVIAALIVLGATIRTFDRCMGRIPERCWPRGRPLGLAARHAARACPASVSRGATVVSARRSRTGDEGIGL
jgi:ABC-type transport system involved in multi-copper enzyme maturation permease subunit